MKTKMYLVLSLILTISAAHAGNEAGHGGSALVCHDASGAIQSVQSLDLVEGSLEYGLQIQRKDEPVADQVQLAGIKLVPTYTATPAANSLWRSFQTDYAQILANVRYLPTGFGILPIDDSYPVITPPTGCDFEQLANYDPSGNVLIASDLFQMMSSTDQAALFVHETIYKMERDDFYASNSIESRKVVAYMFASVSVGGTSTALQILTSPWAGTWAQQGFCSNLSDPSVPQYTITSVDPVSLTFQANGVTVSCQPGWTQCTSTDFTFNGADFSWYLRSDMNINQSGHYLQFCK